MLPFLCGGGIWIVFHFVINSGMLATWYLLSCKASLSNPCIPSWPGIFPIRYFLSVAFVSPAVCLPQSLLRVLIYLPCYLSIQHSLYDTFVPIFYFKIVLFLWRQVVDFPCAISTNHRHHVVPLARISLTLSRHFSLSFIASGRSSRLHPVSSHSYCMYVRAGRPAFAWPYAGVHWSTSLMSTSLLLQQCPACLIRLTWIVFVMGGMWPYSWCLVGCCR